MNASNSKRYLLQGLIRKLLAAAWIVASFVVLGLPHSEAWSRISASSQAAKMQGTLPKAATSKSAESAGASRSRIIITNGWWV